MDCNQTRLTITHERERDISVSACADGDEQILPGLHALARDGQDPISGNNARSFCGRPGSHRADDWWLILVDRHFGPLREHNRHDDDGEEDVHDRSHDQNLEPLPLRS